MTDRYSRNVCPYVPEEKVLMNPNESTLDRIIRLVGGAVLAWLGFGGTIEGTLGVILGVVGIVFVVTGAVGWCPIYKMLNVSTKKS